MMYEVEISCRCCFCDKVNHLCLDSDWVSRCMVDDEDYQCGHCGEYPVIGEFTVVVWDEEKGDYVYEYEKYPESVR